MTFVQKFEDEKDRLLCAPHGYELVFNNFSVYQRSDSLLVNFYLEGKYQEFMAPSFLHDMVFDDQLLSVEVLESNVGPSLFLFKTRRYENRSGSAWTQWFHTTENWIIIDLKHHAVVFDFKVVDTYFQRSYSYDGDITDESLTEEEFDRLYETRQESTSECGFALDVEFDENLKMVVTNRIAPYDDADFCEPFFLKEGTYQWIRGRLEKIE